MDEAHADRESRLQSILDDLYEEYPDATISLDYSNRLELLVAVVLSAQCTDERVNSVTPEVFEVYPDVEALAVADQDELASIIGSITYPNSKAEYLRNAAQQIKEDHDGNVPDTMTELTALPGVGRKTANVVLQHGHDIREGVVVDTHVMRLSRRLALTNATTRDAIERQLMELVPRDHWQEFTHLMISHGRAVCTARSPDCDSCVIESDCPSSQVRNDVDLAAGEPWND